MKKVLLLCGVCLLATSCGEKKLTCTKSSDEGTEKIVVSFANDKAKSMEMVSEAKSEEEAKMICTFMKMGSEVEKIKESGLKVECNGNKVTMKIADVEKYAKISGDSEEFTGTFDKIKKEAEEDGYTCK